MHVAALLIAVIIAVLVVLVLHVADVHNENYEKTA